LFALTFAALLALRILVPRADRHADSHAVGSASPAYARALEKLHEWSNARAGRPVRWSHPSLYDRMVAAGVTPDWARPSRSSVSIWLPMFLFGFVAQMLALFVMMGIARFPAGWPERTKRSSHLMAIARGGDSMVPLLSLGAEESFSDRREEALVWFEAASAVSPESPEPHMYSAIWFAEAQRCAEARRELAEAELRLDQAIWQLDSRALLDQARNAVDACEEAR
jgi:hypothetical protein